MKPCDSPQPLGKPITDRLTRIGIILDRCVVAMTDRCFELDTNEAAVVIHAYRLARGAGYPTENLADALVDVLERQMRQTDDDGDDDRAVDDGQEAA